ncbi:dnaJ domain protein [Clostridioides difficile CD160]|nr:dnaJ domain protein [Clostridioides difficile CD160]
MEYFKNVKSLEELKNTFKKLARKHHPDMGGNEEVMKEINNQYESAFLTWKKRSKVMIRETANSTRHEFYTKYGWKGENYSSNLSVKDIAKIIRRYVKEIYPSCKFSVTATSSRTCSTIDVSLMEAPFSVFNSGLEKNYIQVNHYNILADNRLNSVGKSILIDLYNILKSYHYDDSDGMIDYFNTNFFMYLNIGKWNKPFRIVEKTSKAKNGRKS